MDAVLSRLPRKLTLTMWDFSWYTMTLPGEPYHDLAARCKEAADRGYNTIRICAMPFLLFTAEGKRPGPLHFGSLGKWDSVPAGITAAAVPSWTGMRICWSCSDRPRRTDSTLCCLPGNISRAPASWPTPRCVMSWLQLLPQSGS